jgi:hypothetical protein
MFGVRTVGNPHSNIVQLECVSCHKVIDGTMTYEIAMQAIMKNSARGGVKCPECREMSCAVCGTFCGREGSWAIWRTGQAISADIRSGMICSFCEDELGQDGLLAFALSRGFTRTNSELMFTGSVTLCPVCSNGVLYQLPYRTQRAFCPDCGHVGYAWEFSITEKHK